MAFRKVQFVLLALLMALTKTVPADRRNGTLAHGRPEVGLLADCDVNCPWTSHLDIRLVSKEQSNASNRDAYLSESPEWCGGQQFPEPMVHARLPACKNITVQNGTEFTIDANKQLVMRTGKWSLTTGDYQLASNGSAAVLCFPLSPQLLQCGLKRLNRHLYSYDASQLALVNCRTKEATHLRDYYTSPDSGDILACNVSIGIGRSLRCNYVEYGAKEYEFSDANTSIRLLPNGATIYRPEYEVLNASGAIRVCHPMSPEMTTCKLWTLLAHEYTIGVDRRVNSPSQGRIYDLDEYIITKSNVAVCKPNLNRLEPSFDVYNVMAMLQVLSAVFLFLSFVIHLLVPSLNYHAKPLLCHMFSMVVMYICVACRKLVNPIPPAGCYTLFIFTYFSAMTSFFWLNVLSFDLWSIFANLQTTSRLSWACSCAKKHNFFYYCIFAYGCPALIVVLCVLLDTQTEFQDFLGLRPGVGQMCWFNERKSAFVLFYGPLFILLAINVFLFVLTVFNLRHASRGAEIVNKKLNKQLLFVCFKIFVIMGLCWIAEAIAFVVKADGNEIIASDIVNAIQGVFLFIIYICKPATYRLLRKKLMPSPPSEGTWTTDLNSSKGHERKSSSSGNSMKSVVGHENSVNGQSFSTKLSLTRTKSQLDAKV